jgi:hypothetical protein
MMCPTHFLFHVEIEGPDLLDPKTQRLQRDIAADYAEIYRLWIEQRLGKPGEPVAGVTNVSVGQAGMFADPPRPNHHAKWCALGDHDGACRDKDGIGGPRPYRHMITTEGI